MGNNSTEQFDLYNQFRQKLALNDNASLYFDEIDLIEIYDYASDNDDQYIKLESLMCGARLFPNSEPLAVRRAYYYYSNGDNAAATELVKLFQQSSPLWDLLELKLECPSTELATRRINEILTNTSTLDDETVIQLVNFIEEYSLFSWALKNKDFFANKCEYPSTLYYELGTIADSIDDFANAAALYEEATMQEPFNIIFWECLAQTHYNNEEYNKARNAIDYALAIECTSLRSLLLKAQILVVQNQTEEAANILKSILNDNPQDAQASRILAMLYDKTGQTDMAVSIIQKMAKIYPSERIWVDCLLTELDTDFNSEIIDSYYNSTNNTEEQWIEWAVGYLSSGKYTQAAHILLCLYRHNELTKGYSVLYEILYRMKRYDEISNDVISLYNNNKTPNGGWRPEMILVAVLSLIHIGNTDFAMKIVNEVLSSFSFPELIPYFDKIAWLGVLRSLQDIKAAHNADDNIPIDDIDPFYM